MRHDPHVSPRATDTTSAHHAERVVDLAERLGPKLVGFARRLGLTDDQADDAVQEVMLRLFRTLAGGTTIADDAAWAFHALYRLSIDEHRSRSRLQRLRERLGPGLADRGSDDPDHAGRISIWATVDRLPGRQRQIIYLRYRADLSFAEIAAVMGISAGGARAQATKGLDRIRLLLGPDEDLR